MKSAHGVRSARVRDGIRLVSTCALAAWIILLASCATVSRAPRPGSPEDALLVVQLQASTELPGINPVFYYSLAFDNQEATGRERALTSATGYTFITGLTPGAHEVTRVYTRRIDNQSIVNQFDYRRPFTLKAGEATILPVRFTVRVRKDAENRTVQAYTISNLSPTDVERIREELRGYENFELWGP